MVNEAIGKGTEQSNWMHRFLSQLVRVSVLIGLALVCFGVALVPIVFHSPIVEALISRYTATCVAAAFGFLFSYLAIERYLVLDELQGSVTGLPQEVSREMSQSMRQLSQELSASVRAIRSAIEGPHTRFYETRDGVYLSAVDAIRRCNRTQTRKDLLLGALHGHTDQRSLREVADHVFEAWSRAIGECIRSPESTGWSVKILFTVGENDRLNQFVERIIQYGDVEGFEVKAFYAQKGLQHICPLVVGTDSAWFAIEDSKYFRVRRAIVIEDKSAIAFANDFFFVLWNRVDAYQIRRATGLDTKEVDRLRAEITNRNT